MELWPVQYPGFSRFRAAFPWILFPLEIEANPKFPLFPLPAAFGDRKSGIIRGNPGSFGSSRDKIPAGNRFSLLSRGGSVQGKRSRCCNSLRFSLWKNPLESAPGPLPASQNSRESSPLSQRRKFLKFCLRARFFSRFFFPHGGRGSIPPWKVSNPRIPDPERIPVFLFFFPPVPAALRIPGSKKFPRFFSLGRLRWGGFPGFPWIWVGCLEPIPVEFPNSLGFRALNPAWKTGNSGSPRLDSLSQPRGGGSSGFSGLGSQRFPQG